MPPAFPSRRRLPPLESRASTLAGARSGALLPLADGRRRCTFSSRFETATRPLSAPLSRASVGRVRFNDLCRSMFQRARRWTHRASQPRNPWPEWPPFRSIVASRSTATAEGSQGQGSRITEPRRSLSGLLPGETSPRPRLLQTPRVAGIARSPCPELAGATGEAAGAAGASKARAAAGR